MPLKFMLKGESAISAIRQLSDTRMKGQPVKTFPTLTSMYTSAAMLPHNTNFTAMFAPDFN